MKKITIKVNGKEYPCRQTMGAMLRFKRETGHDITATDGGAGDMCIFMWCCVSSSCNADGVAFDMSLEDFADAIGTDELAQWSAAVTEGAGSGAGEKKTRRQT